ncbi:DMT family transporter [Kineosporia babensis]|uniref:DMT family transporter n=1 Tax=Kineosporia babensis TaxID=499548 RepID=A0A9X1SXL4_9ACTN|nr:DMT family transporter [Kineosporia babensis]MCD5315310.1 DMT family transporter [Kineosporia babensis]
MFPARLRSLLSDRRTSALAALTIAGITWGTTVPLSKAAFAGFGPAWLTVFRFAVAGLVIVAVVRPRLSKVRPALWAYGAFGYGACVLLQNIGLERTSVTHAALLLGSVPVIVAVLAVIFNGARVGPIAWVGFALSLIGIVVVAGAGGGDATLTGDLIVLGSVLIGAVFTILQARLLPGQDVVAVSTAQFLASAVAVLPFALLTESVPTPGVGGLDTGALLAALALGVFGTVLPFTLFAYGQTGVEPHIAGVFLNLETLVATTIAIVVLGEPLGGGQVAGGLALLVGIYIGTVYQSRTSRVPVAVSPATAQPAGYRVSGPRTSVAGARSGSTALPPRQVARPAPGLHLFPDALGLADEVLERDGQPMFTRAA